MRDEEGGGVKKEMSDQEEQKSLRGGRGRIKERRESRGGGGRGERDGGVKSKEGRFKMTDFKNVYF